MLLFEISFDKSFLLVYLGAMQLFAQGKDNLLDRSAEICINWNAESQWGLNSEGVRWRAFTYT